METVLGVKEETGGLLEQEKKLFFAEAEKEQKENSEVGEEGEKTEKRKVSSLFLTEVFQEERQELLQIAFLQRLEFLISTLKQSPRL